MAMKKRKKEDDKEDDAKEEFFLFFFFHTSPLQLPAPLFFPQTFAHSRFFFFLVCVVKMSAHYRVVFELKIGKKKKEIERRREHTHTQCRYYFLYVH